MLRMADVLPSPLSMLTTVITVWVGTRIIQLVGRKYPAVLLGGVIPSGN